MIPEEGSNIRTVSFCDWLSQRVMMQIVQELCKRPGLNKCGFDMPTIYIPNPNKVRLPLSPSLRWFDTFKACTFFFPCSSFYAINFFFCSSSQPSRCVNQIEEVCRTIERTINQTVQNTLNSLEKDCELVSEAINDTLINDRWLRKNKNIFFPFFFKIAGILSAMKLNKLFLYSLQL